MKVLTKNVYYHYATDGKKRLWHDCKNYKKDQERRIELEVDKEDKTVPKDHTRFKCLWCDYSYDLDNNLKLIQSKQ